MDADGLVRSFFNAQTLKPFTNEELQEPDWKKRVTDWGQNTPDPASYVAYENALMGTGEFAISQIERFQTTGEEAAHAAAHRCIQAILSVIEEGRRYMPGYLPKPFGGIAHARDSHEISVDQYTKAIAALYAWLPLASDGEKQAITQFFVDAADFFIARKFRHAYRHRTIVTAATHLHSLGLFVCLPWLAAQASGDKTYLRHLKNFAEALEAARADEGLSGFNQTSLVIEGFHTALLAGADDPLLPELIGLRWDKSAARVLPDGTALERDEPTSQTTRLAAVATLVETHCPDRSCVGLATRILSSLTAIDQMRNPRVPGAISTTSTTSWLLAYWRLRHAGAIQAA